MTPSKADAGIENTDGIISQAIKTAAEQGPLTPKAGIDSASLLQPSTIDASHPPSAAKTQFTFAVESESASKMVDQPAAVTHTAYTTASSCARGTAGQNSLANQKGNLASQGTQTTPSARGNNGGQAGSAPSTSAARPPPNPDQGPQQGHAPTRPKHRRRPSREFAVAARQRRLQQEYTNYHHRPNVDNMWVCGFCDYEDIYGVPPVALIRQYEIKDRQERNRAAERRRLLEKAKSKSKKGKKGGKKGAAGAPTAANQSHPETTNPAGPMAGDDEYYGEEGYADEYDPVGAEDDEYYPPPAVPSGTPTVGPGSSNIATHSGNAC